MPSVVACFIAETLKTCGRACSVFLTSDSEEAQHTFVLALAANNISAAGIHGDIVLLQNAAPGVTGKH